MIWRYTVDYRRDVSGRVHRVVVVARSTDDARETARLVDPKYLSTVRSPRRGRALSETGDYK